MSEAILGGSHLDTLIVDVMDTGFDRIRDFSNGETIDLSAYGIEFSDLNVKEVSGSARITFDAGTGITGTIQLDNVAAATIDAGDFFFW